MPDFSGLGLSFSILIKTNSEQGFYQSFDIISDLYFEGVCFKTVEIFIYIIQDFINIEAKNIDNYYYST